MRKKTPGYQVSFIRTSKCILTKRILLRELFEMYRLIDREKLQRENPGRPLSLLERKKRLDS